MHSSRSTEAAASIGQHAEFAISLARGGVAYRKDNFCDLWGIRREVLLGSPGIFQVEGIRVGKEIKTSASGSAKGLGSRAAVEAEAIASSRGSSYVDGRG